MISPLGQRQMFQTVNAEAVRSALEGTGLLQREAMHKQVIMDQMAEDQASVLEIPKSEAPRRIFPRGARSARGQCQIFPERSQSKSSCFVLIFLDFILFIFYFY